MHESLEQKVDFPLAELYNSGRPTDKAHHEQEGGWYMKGIEPRGNCPTEGCNRTFKRTQAGDFKCPEHNTEPKHFILNFKYKGIKVTRGTDFAGNTLHHYSQAFALRSQSLSEINQGIFSARKWNIKERSEYLFEDLMDEFVELKRVKLERKELSPAYLEKLDGFVKNHYSFFLGKDVRDIHELETFDAQIKSKASHRLVICTTLVEFFNWVRKSKRLISDVPSIPEMEIEEVPIIVAPREVQENFLTVLPAYLVPVFAWMIYQGCRVGEVCALKWDSISSSQGENDTVTYRRTWSGSKKPIRALKEKTKSKKNRDNYVFPETRPYLPKRSFPQNFVFTDKKGQNFFPNNLTIIFQVYLKKYNVKYKDALHITLYQFTKHSFGTRMINLHPEHQYALQKHFGHSDAKTMERYSAIDNVKVWRQIDNVEKLSSTKVPQGSL